MGFIRRLRLGLLSSDDTRSSSFSCELSSLAMSTVSAESLSVYSFSFDVLVCSVLSFRSHECAFRLLFLLILILLAVAVCNDIFIFARAYYRRPSGRFRPV